MLQGRIEGEEEWRQAAGARRRRWLRGAIVSSSSNATATATASRATRVAACAEKGNRVRDAPFRQVEERRRLLVATRTAAYVVCSVSEVASVQRSYLIKPQRSHLRLHLTVGAVQHVRVVLADKAGAVPTPLQDAWKARRARHRAHIEEDMLAAIGRAAGGVATGEQRPAARLADGRSRVRVEKMSRSSERRLRPRQLVQPSRLPLVSSVWQRAEQRSTKGRVRQRTSREQRLRVVDDVQQNRGSLRAAAHRR